MLAAMSDPPPSPPSRPLGDEPAIPSVAEAPAQVVKSGSDEPPASSSEDDDESSPFTWRVVVGLVVLGLVGWFVLSNLVSITKIQDCVWSGRRNCSTVDDPNPR